ncbi:glycoside hydrolase family 9 protein [Chitinophaga rhizophila]|uniref:Endoglucanase n=1 Tax=Chitinophaga rhizophila TaxID=2866212 RepID=A0ABS7GN28_9BACT|nr:glycoside hydrolase family 9 protein [Chitinophaga rhizophila]MBW8688367.1 glycoside hydrolase family 9 protein [Chitinophaga rhizophila]
MKTRFSLMRTRGGGKLCLPVFLTILMMVSLRQTKAQSYNYAEVLQKSMFFYEAQRSGALPADNRVTWRGNSALNDGSDVGKNLTGGWYDAGDHVKFNFPMAFSATVLAWGAIDYPAGYNTSGQMRYLKSNLRFVNDYFIRCHTAPNELYGQVGNGGTDHAWWGSAEVMAMARPAYKIDQAHPGSELAAETAAAMAAASMIFKTDDPSYSATLLTHAIQLYNFADNYRGIYTSAITDAASYYQSFSGYNDELVWGAIWLYRATGDAAWLTKAETYYANLSTEPQSTIKSFKWGLAWDDKSYGCYALLAKLTGKAQYKQDIERHLDYWTDGYSGQRISYTPGGLAFLDTWGALRYAINTSFVAAYYSDAATTAAKAAKYTSFANSQMSYALGNNPNNRSYVCGFGVNPPTKPHHRTAHGCWSNNLNGPPTESRHILYGALVGGPGRDDSYTDDRGNYVNNEVACDYNAAFSGLLSKMIQDHGGTPLTNFPVPETPTGEFLIEAKINGSGPTYTEWSVWVNNHTAWPSRIASKHAYRLFIDITEGLNAGYRPSDYVISSNNAEVTFTPLQQWNTSSSIYYTEVTYNPTIKIWPGGQGESRKESQIRIRLPYEASASAWNATNDWSSQGVDGNLKVVNNIPLYVDNVLVFGNTPTPTQVVRVTGVDVVPAIDTLNINTTLQLTATIAPSNATNKAVTWTSGTPARATVSSTGVVTALTAGRVVITATTADGSFRDSSILYVSNVVAPKRYTITTAVSGTGSVSLSPAGGTYTEGTVVSATATPGNGYRFSNWSGSITDTLNPVNVTVNSNLSLTANFIQDANQGSCDNPSPATLPFKKEGVGEFCYVISGNISFVNSWNLSKLEINGVDFTNTWSNNLPPKVNGQYYIHYVGSYGWSHFEANGAATAARSAGGSVVDKQTNAIFPNPVTQHQFTVRVSDPSISNVIVTLTDMSGRVMLRKVVKANETISLSDAIPSGIYNVDVSTKTKKIMSSKLLIQQ